MINMKDIMETVQMIEEEHLDIRTITMGISLLSCCDPDIDRSCQKVYDKITTYAKTWCRWENRLRRNTESRSSTSAFR